MRCLQLALVLVAGPLSACGSSNQTGENGPNGVGGSSAPGGAASETKIAKKSVAYGFKAWATPWEVNGADTDRASCPGNS